MGNVLQGKRVEDFVAPHLLKPGEYTKIPEQRENYYWPGKPYWYVCHPDGSRGILVTHAIIEHDDGTITVSPSILCLGGNKWHGFLEKGVWREG